MSLKPQAPLSVVIPQILLPGSVFDRSTPAQRDQSFGQLPVELLKALARQQSDYSGCEGLDIAEAWLFRHLGSQFVPEFEDFPPWAMLWHEDSPLPEPKPHCRWWASLGHVQVGREGVTFRPAEAMSLNEEELNACWQIIEPLIAARQWTILQKVANRHVLLDAPQALPMEQASPWSLQNVRLTDFMPLNPECAEWRRLWHAIQVELAQAEFNQKRAAQGKPEVNCLWFWGGGREWSFEHPMPVFKVVSAQGLHPVPQNATSNTAEPAFQEGPVAEAFASWVPLLQALLPGNEDKRKGSAVYCLTFEGWGGDMAAFEVLRTEVLRPMMIAGLAFEWVLMGQEGWKVCRSNWKGRFKVWKNRPDWVVFREPVQPQGPTEEELRRAWQAGEDDQRTLNEEWN